MRIAVASQGLDVAARFEQCESFMCYTVNHGIIAECQNMPNLGLPYQDLAKLLGDLDVCALIVGAIPFDIARVFCSADIEVVAGAQGSARTVVEQYLTKTLIGVDEMCHEDEAEEEALAGMGCALS